MNVINVSAHVVVMIFTYIILYYIILNYYYYYYLLVVVVVLLLVIINHYHHLVLNREKKWIGSYFIIFSWKLRFLQYREKKDLLLAAMKGVCSFSG